MADTTEKPIEPTADPLKNRKHEVFANQIARGKTLLEAYDTAGFVVRGPESKANASRVLSRPEVQGRIAWFQLEAAKITIYDAAWIKDRLARHAEHLTEVVEVEQIVETEVGKGRNAKTVKKVVVVKQGGPLFNASAGNRALELLGKDHGLFKDKIELGGTVRVANTELFERLTRDERQTLRGMLVAALQRMPRPANENTDGDVQKDDAEAG